jgi:hypothetical protein
VNFHKYANEHNKTYKLTAVKPDPILLKVLYIFLHNTAYFRVSIIFFSKKPDICIFSPKRLGHLVKKEHDKK